MSGPSSPEEPVLFGIQKYDSITDYPDWFDYDKWDDQPTRYTTEAAAQAVIDEKAHKEWAFDKERYDRELAQWTPLHDLYMARRQVLVDAGLWPKPGEQDVYCLVYPGWRIGVPREDPVVDTSGYRIVPDADMDHPVGDHEWWDGKEVTVVADRE